VSFVSITLCVASQRVFFFVSMFRYDSVRKLLDTNSYAVLSCNNRTHAELFTGHIGVISMKDIAY
jgi:hypothetical protein